MLRMKPVAELGIGDVVYFEELTALGPTGKIVQRRRTIVSIEELPGDRRHCRYADGGGFTSKLTDDAVQIEIADGT